MSLLRCAVVFLTFFLAFGLRHNDEAPWVFGLVLVLSGVGEFLGTHLAPQLRMIAREEVILAGSLVLPAVGCLFAARSASLAMTTLGAVLIAAGAAAGRVAFDSLLQRDAPDAIRGRSFARFETRFQITWVAGALIPVAIAPVYQDLRIGLFVLAIGLGFAGLSYIAGMRAAREAVARRRRRMERTRETVERGFRAGLARLRHPRRRARTGGGPSQGSDEIVGTGRLFSFELTMPGGRLLPAAAVSWIAVLPTHRRRGILTAIKSAQLDDAAERGEPLAMLYASEAGIYRRFGYGVSTSSMSVSVARRHAAFLRPVPDGRIRLVDEDDARKLFPEIFDRARRVQPGPVQRVGAWWPHRC